MKNTTLDLDTYCDGCPDISPKVDTLQANSVFSNSYIVSVKCKNAEKCKRMRDFLEASFSKDEEQTSDEAREPDSNDI